MEAEEQICEVEVRVVEITDTEKNKEKRTITTTTKKPEEHVRDLWDNIKHQYLHHRGSRGEEG